MRPSLALPGLAAAIALIGGPLVATQWVAAAFDRQSALGEPLLVAADTAIYAPWSILAWSARWSGEYPRPFDVAYFIIATGAALGALVFAAGKRRPALKAFGLAHWGDFAEAKAAGLFAAAGVVLGKLDGEILCEDGPGHQLLIGASRSGKGRGHVVPTLLAWSGSAVVLDVKGELAAGDDRHGFPGTAGFRSTLGPVLTFAPTREDSAAFNPLFEVRRGPHEVRDVQNIVEAIISPHGEAHGAEAFWNAQAKIVLTGLILHVLYAEPLERKTLAVVREKLRTFDRTAEEMIATLHRRNPETNVPEVHPEVLHAATAYLAGEERLRSGVKATAESFFGLFADPTIAAKTSRSDFRIADLMCGPRPVTLYLQPPPSDVARLMPLMRLLINQLSRGLMESQTHA